MPSSFSLHLEQREHLVVLRLVGRLTLTHLDKFAQGLEAAEQRSPVRIDLDFTHVEHLDSAALGFIAGQYKHFIDRHIEFRLLNPQPQVLKVFHLTSLDRVLRIVDEASLNLDLVQWQRTALWESYQYSQAILDALGEGLLGVDLECRIIFSNQAAEQMLGWSEGQLVNRLLSDLIAAASVPEDWCGEMLFAQHGRQAWANLCRADGSTFEAMLATAVVHRKSERVGILVGINDHMELERSRRNLLSAQQMLSLIADNTSDAILMYDAQGRLSFSNLAAEQLLGYPREQLQGMRFVELGAGRDLSQWERLWRSANSGQAINKVHLLLKDGQGREKWCSANASPVQNETHYHVGIFIAIRDADVVPSA